MSTMKKFSVTFYRKVTVSVDAEQPAEARDVVSRALPDSPNFATPQELAAATIEQVDLSVRTETWVCSWCKNPSLKELWGPGRIHCPRCHKIERSAAEFQALGG